MRHAKPEADQPETDREPSAGDDVEVVALVVCHGMGQQVPFETIDIVARALRCVSATTAQGNGAPAVVTRIVDLGTGHAVGRAELEAGDEKRRRRVHIYEAYWAPLTAGKVSLANVGKFFLGAGVNGLRSWKEPFWRWMFGDWQDFGRAWSTFVLLLFALLCFLSLVVMNATIAVVVANHAIGKPGDWPGPALSASITADLALFAIPALVTGVLLVVAYLMHQHAPDSDRDWRQRKLTGTLGPRFLTLLIWLTLCLALLSGALLTWDLAASARDGSGAWPFICSWLSPACAYRDGAGRWAWAILPIVIGVSYVARKFMIEYVGDVVAYVDSHKVSEFAELRSKIQAVADTIGQAVYSAAEPRYAKVVIVGHSLGSIVAYDMLNRLLLEDCWRNNPLDVHARTSGLLTFGSPLDKTAFIFRSQKLVFAVVREALAAGVQPLIAHASFRANLRWVNLWSGKDWISGALNYYDPKGATHGAVPSPPWAVINIEDPYARIPLVAHTMYWRSPTLAKELLALIMR